MKWVAAVGSICMPRGIVHPLVSRGDLYVIRLVLKGLVHISFTTKALGPTSEMMIALFGIDAHKPRMFALSRRDSDC